MIGHKYLTSRSGQANIYQLNTGRVLDHSINYFWDSYETSSANHNLDSELRLRKAYLDVTHQKQFSEKFSAQFNVYADLMLQNRFPRNLSGRDWTGNTGGMGSRQRIHQRVQDQSEEESAIAGENFTANHAVSEKVQSHDLQFSNFSQDFYAALTPFYMKVKNQINFFAFAGGPTEYGDRTKLNAQGYQDVGDATVYGVELEGKYQVTTALGLYENYTFNNSELDTSYFRGGLTDAEGRYLNVPRHMLNLGVNVSPWDFENTTWMVNNGHHDYRTWDRYYVDLAYNHRDILGSGLDASAFVNNVLDNTSPVGMAINNGHFAPRGRNIGAGLSFQF